MHQSSAANHSFDRNNLICLPTFHVGCAPHIALQANAVHRAPRTRLESPACRLQCRAVGHCHRVGVQAQIQQVRVTHTEILAATPLTLRSAMSDGSESTKARLQTR
jgi:hypothetical protein